MPGRWLAEWANQTQVMPCRDHVEPHGHRHQLVSRGLPSERGTAILNALTIHYGDRIAATN
jgi:hypothetical protein